MKRLLRICNVPTEKFNTVGFHAYKLNQLDDFYSLYISARLEGSPLPFYENKSSVRRFDFLLQPFPKEGNILTKLLFTIRRIFSILLFSAKVIFRKEMVTADIVHIHSPMYYLIALVGKLFNKKVYISFHGEDFNRIKENRTYQFFAKIFDGVFAISPHMVPRLKEIHACPVYFIGNGVDFENFYDLKEPRKKQIVFVASFKHVKRHDLMIEGFQKFASDSRFKEYELKLIGEGERIDHYKEFVQKNAIPNVEFMGQKTSSELLKIYNESEIMCLTSDSEGFPKVVLEALACGCTIVSTKVGSVPTIFGEDYPFYINRPNVSSVAEALQTAAENRTDMKRYFGLINKYSWDNVVKQYEEIYQNDLCIN